MALLDIEMAFLYGEVKEDIYMELPLRFFSAAKNSKLVQVLLKNKFEMTKANKKICLKLNHALYGLVQAARLWWLKFVKALVSISFK